MLVDHIDASSARAAQEKHIIAAGFGRRRHTFQYLWGYAHRPRDGEPWPQVNRTQVLRLQPIKSRPKGQVNKKMQQGLTPFFG